MNYYSFEKRIVIRKFLKWCRKSGYKVDKFTAYKYYDRVMRKTSSLAVFQQNVAQFYEDLWRVEAMVVRKTLKEEDIQDYLAFSEMKMRALGMRNETNVVTTQINNQMNVQNNQGGESQDEIIQKIKANLERFAPLISGVGQAGADGGKQSVPAIPASRQTIDCP